MENNSSYMRKIINEMAYHKIIEPHNDDMPYAQTNKLAIEMRNAGVDLSGPAGKLLDSFGEVEHELGWVMHPEEHEGFTEEEISYAKTELANTFKYNLDLAIKTKDVPRDQLGDAYRTLGNQSRDPLYKDAADFYADMLN